MKKPSPSLKKMFSICSMLGGIIKANQELKEDPVINKLSNHVDNAMKVFNYKFRKQYWETSKDVNAMWTELAKDHKTIIDLDEVPKFMEYICLLVPQKNFEEFMGMGVPISDVVLSTEKELLIVSSVLDLDKLLNDRFDTKAVTIAIKKKVIPKVKKERDKAKPKLKEKKVSSAKIKRSEERKRKERLREMIRLAKEKKNET